MTNGNTKIYGVAADGTYQICRAKPENRGRYNCHHEEHEEVENTPEMMKTINLYNEKILEETYGEAGYLEKSQKSSTPSEVTANHIGAINDGNYLTKEEIVNASNKVAESFSDNDWSFFKKFYEKYEEEVLDDEIHKRFDKAENNLQDILNDDKDEDMQKLREFLGEDIDTKELSQILVRRVGAMTSSKIWTNRSRRARVSLRRSIMNSFDNDMTKDRYISSVLFFGGRCCYCNCILRKNPPRQASGEHLTPVSPEKPEDPLGSTRYGNMALACTNCNGERGNKELLSWLQSTKRIPENEKPNVLGRIRAFRKFALYKEYNDREKQLIESKVKEMEDYRASFQIQKDNAYTYEDGGKIIDKLKLTIFDLQQELRG